MKYHLTYIFPSGDTYERDVDYFDADLHIHALEKCNIKRFSVELNPIDKW